MCSRRARCRVVCGCQRTTCSPQTQCSRRYCAWRVRPTAACACLATARTLSSCQSPHPLTPVAPQRMERVRNRSRACGSAKTRPKSALIRTRGGSSRASVVRTCSTRTLRVRSRSQTALPPCPTAIRPMAACIAAGQINRLDLDLLNTYIEIIFS